VDPYNGQVTYTFLQQGEHGGQKYMAKFEGTIQNTFTKNGIPTSNVTITRGGFVRDRNDPITDENDMMKGNSITYKDYGIEGGEIKSVFRAPAGFAAAPSSARVNVDKLIAARNNNGATVTINNLEVPTAGGTPEERAQGRL
jgi:hypothetical protein